MFQLIIDDLWFWMALLVYLLICVYAVGAYLKFWQFKYFSKLSFGESSTCYSRNIDGTPMRGLTDVKGNIYGFVDHAR
jgi:hypothetical protein